jgi:hypothetical protein
MERNNEVKLVLKFLREKGGTGNVMEALGWEASKFDEGFAFANELQNQDLVKLIYSNFNKNLVVVELTLLGHKEI